MLVLSRKVDEQIIVGDRIRITVVAIRGGYVRLGIEAPAGVSVHRKEVYDTLKSKAEDGPTAEEKADHRGS